jgi:hypothetical protein
MLKRAKQFGELSEMGTMVRFEIVDLGNAICKRALQIERRTT